MNSTLPAPDAGPVRARVFSIVLCSYVLAAAAMAVLAAFPGILLDGASAEKATVMRVAMVTAAVTGGAIAFGGWRRARWTRALALGVHAVIAGVALTGLVACLVGSPMLGGNPWELAAKAGAHLGALWLWATAWVRRQFAGRRTGTASA